MLCRIGTGRSEAATLGFGDIYPVGDLRLIASVEALNGLLMLGWSASFIYLAMEKFWDRGRRKN